MKNLFLANIFLLFSYISAEVMVFGFSDDSKHFAFSYEPKDPMAISGVLKILNTDKNNLTLDTLLDEFNDSYSSLKDMKEFFESHYTEVLGFKERKPLEEYCGNVENGSINILNIKTSRIAYTVNKSINEYGYYNYTTIVKIKNNPPIMMDSKLTDVYGAYMADDSICVIITKGLVIGFEGTFYEDYECFALKGAKEEVIDSLIKENEIYINITKVRDVMKEFFFEHHNIYPNNIDLFNRYGKVIKNPFKKNNESLLFTEKLMKFNSKYEGTIIIVVSKERQSYTMYYGIKDEFKKYKEEENENKQIH
ncbi:MAG: hypothetical protein COX48_02130 [bacterium (Candidatus Stahlbacteria) CG23_combo_of_CG06-09_8_20_14_all_34_7]|nr:MAG: hypothetical protein COX48_02130 [bacterium (Candidatus Stahlbacteria) CG23_combo_of_CG06-09_8_20_14_all_34_7]